MLKKYLKNIFSKKSQRIFLDYSGGTFVLSEVKEEIYKYTDYFANPSGLYFESVKSKELISESRHEISTVLGVQKNEVVFTSGGTESNNHAILGVFEKFNKPNFKPHIITSKIEHSSILEVCKEVERRGGEVTYLKVSSDGRVDSNLLKNSIKDNTVLVSISIANSEIGTINSISDLVKIVKEFRKNKSIPYFHSDFSGASIYQSLNLNTYGLDMATIDSSKIYGPKGIGLLFVKNGTEIMPLIFGGGQERGLRSGTENLPLIRGFSKALTIISQLREKESKRLTEIRDYAIEKILIEFPNAKLNGSRKHRLPNNINICFPNKDAEFAVVELDILGFSVSYSSSCMTLKEDLSSYVVRESSGEECSKSSLRFTLGLNSKKNDIDLLITALKKIIK